MLLPVVIIKLIEIAFGVEKIVATKSNALTCAKLLLTLTGTAKHL